MVLLQLKSQRQDGKQQQQQKQQIDDGSQQADFEIAATKYLKIVEGTENTPTLDEYDEVLLVSSLSPESAVKMRCTSNIIESKCH